MFNIFQKIKNAVFGEQLELYPLTSEKLAACAKKASAWGKLYKIDLDFTLESITRIEVLFKERFEEIQDQRSGLLIALGSYLGETLILNFGGEWEITENINAWDDTKNPAEQQITKLHLLLDGVKIKLENQAFSPFRVVFERLTEKNSDALISYRKTLTKIEA